MHREVHMEIMVRWTSVMKVMTHREWQYTSLFRPLPYNGANPVAVYIINELLMTTHNSFRGLQMDEYTRKLQSEPSPPSNLINRFNFRHNIGLCTVLRCRLFLFRLQSVAGKIFLYMVSQNILPFLYSQYAYTRPFRDTKDSHIENAERAGNGGKSGKWLWIPEGPASENTKIQMAPHVFYSYHFVRGLS
jgi:hypothetical protein